jgi:hypothetical protein
VPLNKGHEPGYVLTAQNGFSKLVEQAMHVITRILDIVRRFNLTGDLPEEF